MTSRRPIVNHQPVLSLLKGHQSSIINIKTGEEGCWEILPSPLPSPYQVILLAVWLGLGYNFDLMNDLNESFGQSEWRLLITPPLTGALNMAIDEAILYALAEGQGQATLRFYQWQPTCLSLGYSQQVTDINQAACAQLGYTWVRRPTGGRAILHTDEVTYSIITPITDPRVKGSVVESYRRLSRGLLHGLQTLGAKAVQAKKERSSPTKGGAACFDTPSHYEVTLNGKKLVGSAQVRRKGMVLQHGSLPLDGDITRIFEVLNISDADKLAQQEYLLTHATTLATALGYQVSFDEAVQALKAGFAETLALQLTAKPLSPYEETLVKKLMVEQYGNDAWNKRL